MYKLRKEIDIHKLNWSYLVDNQHPGATRLIQENIDKISREDFYSISQNPMHIDIILKNMDKIHSGYLSENPAAMHLLLKQPELINCELLSLNPNFKAMEIIEKMILENMDIKSMLINRVKRETLLIKINYPYKISFTLLGMNSNPKAIELIEKYNENLFNNSFEDYQWATLSKNPVAVYLLEKYPEKIDWSTIVYNTNPDAIRMIEQNLDKISSFVYLSENENVMHIVEQNLDKIHDWIFLSKNQKAMHILEKNLDKVNWKTFSENPTAIEILLKNMDKVCYKRLSRNPAIFEYDYQGLKERCDIYREELIKKTMHPSRIKQIVDAVIEIEKLEFHL
jgi:hypothetical protein